MKVKIKILYPKHLGMFNILNFDAFRDNCIDILDHPLNLMCPKIQSILRPLD